MNENIIIDERDSDPRIPSQNVGGMNKILCQFCSAKLWPAETSSPCCANGEVRLPSLQPLPEELSNFFLGNCEKAIDFRKHTRGYNSTFAFASLGVNEGLLPAGV